LARAGPRGVSLLRHACYLKPRFAVAFVRLRAGFRNPPGVRGSIDNPSDARWFQLAAFADRFRPAEIVSEYFPVEMNVTETDKYLPPEVFRPRREPLKYLRFSDCQRLASGPESETYAYKRSRI
jgi:hypothetical protein